MGRYRITVTVSDPVEGETASREASEDLDISGFTKGAEEILLNERIRDLGAKVVKDAIADRSER